MSAMLEKWLRRPFGEVRDDVKPTWKSLCVALSHIDRPLAERLAEEHDCEELVYQVRSYKWMYLYSQDVFIGNNGRTLICTVVIKPSVSCIRVTVIIGLHVNATT